MTEIRLSVWFGSLTLIALGVLNAGCPSLIAVNVPITAQTAGGADPDGNYYRHFFQLTWTEEDLVALKSLTLAHSGSVEIVASETSDTLSVVLPVDVQLDHHEEIANAFESRARQASHVQGTDPTVSIPAGICHETFNARHELVGIQGLCVRKLTLAIPKTKLLAFRLQSWVGEARVEGVNFLELDLSLPDSTIGRLLNVSGKVVVSSGGPGSSLLVDRLNGDFTARLNTVSSLTLNHVSGKILLFQDNPEDSHVSVDGKLITHFPYQYP